MPVKTSATNERLGQEALDLAGPGHRDAVLFGQLVEAEDGDDVLELLVALEDLPWTRRGHGVVALAHDLGRQDVRGRGQRVHGRVDAERGDLADSSVVASRWVKVVNGAGSV